MDFTYDSQDLSAVRAAFTELKEAKNRAFWVSNVVLFSYLGRQAFTSANTSAPLWKRVTKANLFYGFIGSAFIYSCFTLGPRLRMNEAGAKINRKYSAIICKTFDYQE